MTNEHEVSLEEIVNDMPMIESEDVPSLNAAVNLHPENDEPSLEDLGTEEEQAQTEAETPKSITPEVKSYDEYRENLVLMKNKMLQEQRRAAQEREELRELAEQGRRYRELQELKRTNIDAYLEAEKIEADAIVTKWSNDLEAEKNKTPEEKEAEILAKAEKLVNDRLEAERERARQEAETMHKEAFRQATVQNIKQSIADIVASDPDEYELINVMGQQEKVWQELENFYDKFETLPRDKEGNLRLDFVAKAVEQKLRNDDKADRLINTKWFKSKLASGSNGKTANNSNGNQAKTPVTLTSKTSKTSSEIVSREIEDNDAAFQEALKLVGLKDS